MGEEIAARESIYNIYNNQANGTYLKVDSNLLIDDAAYLSSFAAKNLIYVMTPFFAITSTDITLPLRKLYCSKTKR
jgi:hypothetical protein